MFYKLGLLEISQSSQENIRTWRPDCNFIRDEFSLQLY